MAQKTLNDYMMDWLSNLVNGAARVQQAGEGPATQARSRSLVNVTSRQKAEWPAGSNITYLTALAKLPNYAVAYSGTAAAMGTTEVVSPYSRGTFKITGLTAETINLTGLIGAAAGIETAAIRVIDLNTGAVTAASALGNGSYKLVDLAVRKLKFTKSAAVENASVTLTLEGEATDDVYAVLSIDAENDAEADGNLGLSGNPPSSASADAQFIPLPLGEFVKIPLTAALVNGSYGGGRVDVRSVDGTALNIWIGAN